MILRVHDFLNALRNKYRPFARWIKIHSLDETHAPTRRMNDPPNLFQKRGEELMWKHKQKECGILTGLFEIWLGNDVVGEANARKVLDVFVFFVDDMGEFAKSSLVGNFFFKDPHVHLGLTKGKAPGVGANKDANGRPPVAGADDAYLFFGGSSSGGQWG
jgi:hypothetical protein